MLFQQLALYLGVGGLCFLALISLLHICERMRMRLRLQWRRGSRANIVCFVLSTVIATVCAQKGGDVSDHMDGASLLRLGAVVSRRPRVTEADCDFGWQLMEVTTNTTFSYAMPASAEEYPNWRNRGAYADVVRVGFNDWVFPWGDDIVSSVWIYSWGKIRKGLADEKRELTAVGGSMSAVPQISRFWYGEDGNGSVKLTWQNFFAERDIERPVNAQLELCGTGDFIARSNAVERIYRRIDPFDYDGDGLANEDDSDPYLYDGDFYGQTEAWRAYVDQMIGTGRENGYYKLTAVVSDDVVRRTMIFAGDERVVVDEPGTYVFLLEKGLEYEFGAVPYSDGISFSVDDDVPLSVNSLCSVGAPAPSFVWTGGGALRFECPSAQHVGFCCWMPTLRITSETEHLGPGDFDYTFHAELVDCGYLQDVRYHWTCDDGNLCIDSPFSTNTTVFASYDIGWHATELRATATIGTNEVFAVANVYYGDELHPQVHAALFVPSMILVNSNQVDEAKIAVARVEFLPDVATNGTLTLSCVSGGDRIRILSGAVTNVVSWDAAQMPLREIRFEGVRASETLSDVCLRLSYAPVGEEARVLVEEYLTVVEVGRVVLPGAPSSGLVICRGTSVAFDLEVHPSDAAQYMASQWQVRRLRGDGSYSEWEYAAGNYYGCSAIYTPSAGGIYQVRALAGIMGGAVDERYYVWDEHDDYSAEDGSLKHPGVYKAFGVCDESWQLALRNRAREQLGNTEYAWGTRLASRYEFSGAKKECWKCNFFVAYCIRAVGLMLNVQHRGFSLSRFPPLANDWANGTSIAHWQHLGNNCFIQPGYVVGHPDVRNGHCGIVDFDGWGIAAGVTTINRKYEMWLDGMSGYNRYTGD